MLTYLYSESYAEAVYVDPCPLQANNGPKARTKSNSNSRKRKVSGKRAKSQDIKEEPSEQTNSTTQPRQLKRPISLHAKVAALAVEYSIPDLQKYAVANLETSLNSFIWNDNDFCKALLVVNENVPEHQNDIHEMFIDAATEHFGSIYTSAQYKHVISRAPEFVGKVALTLRQGLINSRSLMNAAESDLIKERQSAKFFKASLNKSENTAKEMEKSRDSGLVMPNGLDRSGTAGRQEQRMPRKIWPN